MKKLIQICSLLSLLVVFTVVSAQAQSVKSYTANIPFDFTIGQKSYKSGDYVIRIAQNSTKSAGLSVEDTDGNRLYNTHVLGNGDTAQNDLKLVFNRYEDQLFLSKILTPDRGFELIMSSKEKRIAKEKRPQTEIALVNTKN